MNQPNRGGQQPSNAANQPAPIASVTDIIGSSTAEFVSDLDELAKKTGQNIQSVTTSQIRGIFSIVREIEQETLRLSDDDPLPNRLQSRLTMLKPKLAYQVGRSSNAKRQPMEKLQQLLTSAIDQVLKTGKVYAFRNFMNLFEAIIAYHRFYGGTEKEQR